MRCSARSVSKRNTTAICSRKDGYIYRLYNADGSYQRTLFEQAAVNGADLFLT